MGSTILNVTSRQLWVAANFGTRSVVASENMEICIKRGTAVSYLSTEVHMQYPQHRYPSLKLYNI